MSNAARAMAPQQPTPGKLLTEEQVQAAFDWMLSNSMATAAARAMVLRTEFRMKKVHARLMLNADGAMDIRKATATCHPEYETASEAYFAAEEEWTKQLEQRRKCELIIEAWRTQSSNERGIARMR